MPVDGLETLAPPSNRAACSGRFFQGAPCLSDNRNRNETGSNVTTEQSHKLRFEPSVRETICADQTSQSAKLTAGLFED